MKKTKNRDRINEMIEVVMRVAQGDYNAQVQLSGKNDDLDALGIGINMMIDDIRTRLEIEVQNEKFRQINAQLEKSVAEAKESDRLKSAFLSNMSHEIRTPLNSILGFSEMLSPDMDLETFRYYSNFITSSGSQLVRIIDDILDFSKLESNLMVIFKEACDVGELMNEIYYVQKQNKRLIEKEAVTLRFPSIDPQTKAIIRTDPVRLKQVLNNLINNAIKFTDKGFIEFGCSLKTFNSRDFIEFYVTDTGCGIPEEKQHFIFKRFGQVNKNMLREGNGLGLSICKGLIELLGGQIWFESKSGSGSCFHFSIPFIPDCKPEERSFVSQTEGQIELKGKVIFFAEDNEESSAYLTEILTAEGLIVRQVSNGKQLLDMLHDQIPDLILLDMDMPVMNGYETIAVIRQSGFKVPVIAQTAYAMIEEKVAILNAGCNDYISKPINRKDLILALRRGIMSVQSFQQNSPGGR